MPKFGDVERRLGVGAWPTAATDGLWRVGSPAMDRTDPDTTGDELTLLSQFLDYHRATLVQKVSGLDRQQLGTRLGRSELTLAGLVKHMALVEEAWFGKVLLGREEGEPWASVDWDAAPEWEFHPAGADDPAARVPLAADAFDVMRRRPAGARLVADTTLFRSCRAREWR